MGHLIVMHYNTDTILGVFVPRRTLWQFQDVHGKIVAGSINKLKIQFDWKCLELTVIPECYVVRFKVHEN